MSQIENKGLLAAAGLAMAMAQPLVPPMPRREFKPVANIKDKKTAKRRAKNKRAKASRKRNRK